MKNIPEVLAEIDRRWPGDMSGPANVYRKSNRLSGNPETALAVMEEWDAVQREAGMNP